MPTTLFKTSAEAPATGTYEFVVYTDGTTTPPPSWDERVIPLTKGETFPPIRSCNKGCWRKLTTKFKTGEEAPLAGNYEFAGYTDGTSSPAPTPDEKVIPLRKGERFPPVKSCNKGCWRILQ